MTYGRNSHMEVYPLHKSIIGINGEYYRLMHCCQMGACPDDPHVLY